MLSPLSQCYANVHPAGSECSCTAIWWQCQQLQFDGADGGVAAVDADDRLGRATGWRHRPDAGDGGKRGAQSEPGRWQHRSRRQCPAAAGGVFRHAADARQLRHRLHRSLRDVQLVQRMNTSDTRSVSGWGSRRPLEVGPITSHAIPMLWSRRSSTRLPRVPCRCRFKYITHSTVSGNCILAGVIIHCPESRCEVCMNCHGGLLKIFVYRGKF